MKKEEVVIMTTAEEVITPREKEELFLRFLHSYLTFLIHICGCSSVRFDENEEHIDCKQLENSLTNSLTLIWQMHVAVFTLKTYYKKANYKHGTNLIFDQEQSELVVPQLRKMTRMINYYPFIEKTNKQYCLSLLEQMQCYYEQYELVIVDADLHATPWLASPHNPL